MTNPTATEFNDGLKAMVGNCSIITVGHGDDRSGLIVTSAISLSAEPPQLVACINRSSSSWPILMDNPRFGWCSLGAAHRPVAERFAGFGGVKGTDRYADAAWDVTDDGVWLLSDAPVAFECTLAEAIDRGEQSIIIARVTDVRSTQGTGALVYWNGGFVELPPTAGD